MQQSPVAVLDEVRSVDGLEVSQTSGPRQSIPGSSQEWSSHHDPISRFAIQFGMKKTLLNAAVHVAFTFKSERFGEC